MSNGYSDKDNLLSYVMILLLMGLFGLWIKGIDIESGRQQAGMIIFSLGFVMLLAYVIAQLVKTIKLPLISGYIFAGILAGPYVSGFLTVEMVDRLSLINDLALSFIALTAGGELKLSSISGQVKSIMLNIVFMAVIVLGAVMLLIIHISPYFNFTTGFEPVSLFIFAMLIGVICIARSPSSAIAVINECKAKGPFTGMVLAVTIVTDVLIIVIFTMALAVSKMIISGGGVIHMTEISGLLAEIIVSLIIGALLGWTISVYINRVRRDFLLFLLFIAFGVARLSLWVNHIMEVQYDISLHLEPLLICMSAGFFCPEFFPIRITFS